MAGSDKITIEPDDGIGDVPSSRRVLAGTGLAGGGNLQADRTLAVDFGAVGAIQPVGPAAAAGSSGKVADAGHVHGHGNQAGGALHAVAVASGAAGFISGANQAKLDGIEALADVTDQENVSAALAALAGEPGDVLTRGEDGVAPTWEAPAGGGGIRGRYQIAFYSGANNIQPDKSNEITTPIYAGGGGTSTSMPWAPPRPGSITAITFLGGQSTPIAVGSVTLNPFINGAAVTGLQLASTTGQRSHATFAPGAFPMLPTDRMDPRFSVSSDYQGPFVGTWLIEFTEDEE